MAVRVLSFYQDGCMGCLEQEPINTDVASTMSISIESIDAKAQPDYIKRCGLKVTPTTIILVDDAVAEKVEGVLHREEFIDLLKKYL
ncbi:MAG: thioredoxin family protein [Methanocalculus sp.]|uniref:thioredoxin family protein n=1 Tax=Methanocalculus sp. TaxID=2004547 RepID=UPI002718E1AC|nr:thioredoxin family protein [Methanocalculus sp.]MDO9540118.1 thioredoxin family protein [Methanocalculus sp.]